MVDADTLELRYVGKTVNLLEKRFGEHRRHDGGHLGNWFRSTEVRAVVLERVPPDLNTAERRWIADMRTLGARLINMTDGGTGGAQSAEVRARISADMVGRRHLPETIEKIRAALVGRVRPPEVVAKVAMANRGRHRSAEARARMSAAGAGRVLTAEHRAVIGAGVLRYWASRSSRLGSWPWRSGRGAGTDGRVAERLKAPRC